MAHTLITGAGRGIGRATALALAAPGAILTLVARSEDELASAGAEVRQRGARARVAPADVRDAAALQRICAAAHADAPLDALVDAAGLNRPAPLTDVPLAHLDAMLDVNLRGTLLACRAFGRAVGAGREVRGGGAVRADGAAPAGRAVRADRAVANLSSQMGCVGAPDRTTYCATKHAVNGITKALALEWAPRIRVNAVAPTFVCTPLTEPMLRDDAFRADVLARIPLGRIAEPEDVTGAIAFLLSPAAATITGHVLLADGGWTAR